MADAPGSGPGEPRGSSRFKSGAPYQYRGGGSKSIGTRLQTGFMQVQALSATPDACRGRPAHGTPPPQKRGSGNAAGRPPVIFGA